MVASVEITHGNVSLVVAVGLVWFCVCASAAKC